MAAITPYRSLPADRRVALLTHALKSAREVRDVYVRRLMDKRGGFREATLRGWPADRLAKEIVRMKAESPQDELDLLHLLFVELEPATQIAFLDAAGVRHDNGNIPDELAVPYADADAVRRAVAAVRASQGEDGERYIQTLARYSPDAWPGIEQLASGAATPS